MGFSFLLQEPELASVTGSGFPGVKTWDYPQGDSFIVVLLKGLAGFFVTPAEGTKRPSEGVTYDLLLLGKGFVFYSSSILLAIVLNILAGILSV